MSYRGSLRQCVAQMGHAYRDFNQRDLAIVRVPKGKYYKIMTIAELDIQEPTGDDEGAGMTFFGSINELRSIMSAPYIQEVLPLDDQEKTEETSPDKEDHNIQSVPAETRTEADNSNREQSGADTSSKLADGDGQDGSVGSHD